MIFLKTLTPESLPLISAFSFLSVSRREELGLLSLDLSSPSLLFLNSLLSSSLSSLVDLTLDKLVAGDLSLLGSLESRVFDFGGLKEVSFSFLEGGAALDGEGERLHLLVTLVSFLTSPLGFLGLSSSELLPLLLPDAEGLLR